MAAYVKDHDGRFLHVNQCYRKFFEVELDEVRGRTDDELTPEQTIDGPRRAAGNVTEDEPLQLEYTVPPFDGRPALAVWRFAVRTPEGDLVGACAVAAPVAGSALARRECEHLMAVSQGTEDGPSEMVPEVDNAPSDGDRIAALHDISATAARRADELLSELTAERERRAEAEARAVEGDELRRRSEAAEAALLAERARADEADAAAQRERERADAATAAIAAERSQADDAVGELTAARAELDAIRGRLEGLEAATRRETARAEEAEAAAQQVHARLDEALAELGDAQSELASVHGRLEGADAAAQAERAQTEESLGTAHTQLESARAELRAERDARADLDAQLAAAAAELDATRTQLQAATADLAAERAQRSHTEEEVIGELRERAEEATVSLDATRAELEAAQAQLASQRDQHGWDEAEVIEDLRQRLEHAEATAQQERQRADAAEASVISEGADAEVRLGVAERRIAELEASLADARAHELEATSEHGAIGPRWDSSAQRAFTTALAQSSDWRAGVKSAIGVIGALGGWDAVCAWQPDDRNGFASCFAMWTGESRPLNALETATWQRRQPLRESTIGDALGWDEPRWLAADPRADDRRLQLLAQHGIRGALIVPVRDGVRPVATLELLTVAANEPSRELIDAIETMALQLGHFSHLLSAGAQPHWRFGRA